MTTTEQRLADALRRIDAAEREGRAFTLAERDSIRDALAAYDAQQAWSEKDADAAASEGWIVSRTSDGFDEIQKADDADVFTEDAQAIAHVYWMAGTGSEMHKRAIAYTLRPGNAWPYTQASIAARAKRCAHARMCIDAHDGLVSALQGVLSCGERYRPDMGRDWNHAIYGDALDALAAAGVRHA